MDPPPAPPPTMSIHLMFYLPPCLGLPLCPPFHLKIFLRGRCMLPEPENNGTISLLPYRVRTTSTARHGFTLYLPRKVMKHGRIADWPAITVILTEAESNFGSRPSTTDIHTSRQRDGRKDRQTNSNQLAAPVQSSCTTPSLMIRYLTSNHVVISRRLVRL